MPNWKKVVTSGSNAHLNHITASGNISASNNFIGKNISLSNVTLPDTNDDAVHYIPIYQDEGLLEASNGIRFNPSTDTLTLGGANGVLLNGGTGHITASGDISSSGNVYGNRLYIEDLPIVKSGDTISLGSNGLRTTSRLITNHITASGNISASGNLYVGDDLYFNTPSPEYWKFNTHAAGYLDILSGSTSRLFFGAYGSQGEVLGIGTQTPTKTLTVTGEISASGDLFVNNITASAGNFSSHITASGNISSSGGTQHYLGGKLSIGNTGTTTTEGALQVGGDIYGKKIDGEYSELKRFGGLYFTWDGDSYGSNKYHSIRSTENNTYTDSLTFNSYDKLMFNIDSNDNNNNSFFRIGHHGTGSDDSQHILDLDDEHDFTLYRSGSVGSGAGTINFHIDGAAGNVTASGNISSSGDIISNKVIVGGASGSVDGLTVAGAISASGDIYLEDDKKVRNVSGDAYIRMNDNGILVDSDNYLNFAADVSTNFVDGNVGIGTEFATTPPKTLTVTGEISASGDLFVNNITASAGNFSSHITASGNISASATSDITAGSGSFSRLEGVDKIQDAGSELHLISDDLQFHAESTKWVYDGAEVISMDLSTNPIEFAMTKPIDFGKAIKVSSHITASGNISSSGTITMLTASIGGGTFTSASLAAGGGGGGSGTVTQIVAGDGLNGGTITSTGTISVDSASMGSFYSASMNSFTTAGSISASGTSHTFGGQTTLNQITASAFQFIGSGTAELEVEGHITASGNISSSGTIIAEHITSTDDLTATDMVQGGRLSSTGNTTFGNSTDDTHTFTGHITASGDISVAGDISASGDVYADDFVVAGVQSLDSSGTTLRLGYNTTHTKVSVGRVGTTADFDVIGNTQIYGHITASGNISASGASHTFGGNITANSSVIASSQGGFHWGDSTTAIYSDSANSITIKTNDEDTFQIGTYGVKVPFGNVTASGDISSSGNYIGNRRFNITSNTDATHQGDIVYFGGTTSMDDGKIYHYKSDGTWELADADAVATSDGLLAVALGAASDTNGMLLRGMVTLDHDPGAVGDVLFLATGGTGQATATAPSGNTDIVRVVGYCLDASNGQIWFNPSSTFVEVSA